jgi:hypothetical protein
MDTYVFNDLYNFDKNAGIVQADTSDLKSRVEDMMRIVFGADIDVTSETPMGRLIECMVVLMTMTLGINAQNANQYNLNQATGIFLDSLGNLFKLPRHAATHTRVNATVKGTAGTVIPTTAIVANNAGYQFSPEVEITIGNDGTATGYFLAIDDGAIPCDAGTMTTIVSGVVGWDSVSNDTTVSTVYGSAIETDAAYRKRLMQSRSTGTANVNAIANAIYNADENVSSCIVLENGYGHSAVKQGVTLPPHSVYICVYGGDDDKIAEAIYNTKTVGAQYTRTAGTAQVVNKVKDGTPVLATQSHVFFFRPIETSLTFYLNISRNLYSGADLVGDIKTQVMNYVIKSGIGATISSAELNRYLNEKISNIKINSISFARLGVTEELEEYTLDANRIAVTTTDNITVSVS